ncbi:hypothetical protein AHF37_06531 [Paragonimus kellicotti]|nr:hypothetical protein AHF37_06531 [Paragonimus kellicotti]
MDDILEGALKESSGLGVELLPGARLTDLEYADDIVLLSPSAEDMQTMLNKVNDRAGLYGMRFAPSKCKVLLQDWGISTPTFLLQVIRLRLWTVSPTWVALSRQLVILLMRYQRG